MILKTSDVIALVSAAVAGLSLAISIYAISSQERVATSGFQSAQRVKLDTAELLSALRGIMVKAALYTQQDPKRRDDLNYSDYIDIRPEKASIQRFLNSATAVAYYAFVARKSSEARKAGKKGEQWRIFFLSLEQLLNTSNTYGAGKSAAKIETMFDDVSEEDIEEMSTGLEDLPGSVRKILKERPYDPIIQVMTELGAKGEADSKFPDFVAYLREQGVKDPDVDLFWSAISGDKNVAEDALNRGAKLNTTQGDIISKYQDLWKRFIAAPPTN
jgi:hypothetical protein